MTKKIMVIDDDVLVLKTIQNLLNRKGYIVSTAKNGSEAIELINSDCFDLLVCDVRMPREDGIDLMRKLLKLLSEKNIKIPFIFVTGYASEEAPLQAMELGASGYILKPLDMNQLLACVEKSLLGGRVTADELITRMICLIEDFKTKKKDLIVSDKDLSTFIRDLEGISGK